MTKLFWPFWPLCISDVYKNVCLQIELASIDIEDRAAPPHRSPPAREKEIGEFSVLRLLGTVWAGAVLVQDSKGTSLPPEDGGQAPPRPTAGIP